ncbi:PAS domain S-box protein [candidate division KSB1 bacterium]|nr:PAS domain S-box protein [candidate division KSB1 bacterium]
MTTNYSSKENNIPPCFSINNIFQQILLNSFDCVIVLENREVIYVNPGFVETTGFNLTGLEMKREFLELIHPEDRNVVNMLLMETEKNNHSVQQNFRILTATNEVRWLKSNSAFLIEEGNQYVLLTAHDVTDRRYMENQLVQAQKMESISQMAPGLAHEFNNQLKGILGLSSHLESTMSKDHPHRREVSLIVEVAEQASELISQLLDFSRNASFRLKVTNPNKIISEVICLFSHTINPQIRLELNLSPKIKSIKADQIQLKHVLFNVLINARDALQSGGLITIGTENITLTESLAFSDTNIPPGEYVHILVHDTGSGMDESTLNRIFEPFFTSKQKQQGTGLGMTIVREIMTRHLGYVIVNSEPGNFTKVSLYFPVTCDTSDTEVNIVNLDDDFINRYLKPGQKPAACALESFQQEI